MSKDKTFDLNPEKDPLNTVAWGRTEPEPAAEASVAEAPD